MSANATIPVRNQVAGWETVLPTPARIRLAVLAILVALVYHDEIRGLVNRWINDGNWSHGWLIPAFSVYFLASRRQQLAAVQPRTSLFGLLVLVASLVGYFVAGWRFGMGYPQSLSLVGTIFGVTLFLGGWQVMRVAWFPIVFLALAIPLPQQVYVDLTMPLRKLASQVAAAAMPLFAPGLHTEAQAVVIDYVMPGRGAGQLNVEEACSGMRSIMAFVTLGVAMAYLNERPTWQRIVLLASCVPIAVFCNTIRVTTTGLFFVYGHSELARGTPHTLLGVAMFALALGLYSALSYALGNLFVQSPEDRSVTPA